MANKDIKILLITSSEKLKKKLFLLLKDYSVHGISPVEIFFKRLTNLAGAYFDREIIILEAPKSIQNQALRATIRETLAHFGNLKLLILIGSDSENMRISMDLRVVLIPAGNVDSVLLEAIHNKF